MIPPKSQDPSDEPLYNIGVVARMTDIPVATLRIWERRYGFPSSARTGGGHRLYSEQEILRLRWIKARIDEGMQTGRAIRALQHLEQENRLSAALPAAPASRPAQRPAPAPYPVDTSLASYRRQLTEALLGPDTQQADRLLGEALALYPLESLILDMIQPALADLGEAWRDGTINVAVEHLASNFLRHRLLMWMATGPQPRSAAPVILACAPEEFHEGSLLMLGVLLRRQGWPVTYLGQALPLPDLAAFVKEAQPSVVVLIAMREEAARNLLDWPRWLPEAAESGHPVVCFGGRIFTQEPVWRERVSGVYLGETLQEGMGTLAQLLENL
jgi:DNA-binding transcriptional MerR regulator